MPDLTSFYLNSKRSAVLLETITLRHPNFSKIYYLVRNAIAGVTATDETSTARFYEYAPMAIERANVSGDLDQAISVTFGDVGDTIQDEVDRVRTLNGMLIYPTAEYRQYSSVDLSAPLLGPYVLDLVTFDVTREGTALSLEAPMVNASRTGQVYSTTRFPALRGYQ